MNNISTDSVHQNINSPPYHMPDDNIDYKMMQLRNEAVVGNMIVNDTMDKLRRLQDEIEWKHKQERADSQKTINDIIMSNRLFMHQMKGAGEGKAVNYGTGAGVLPEATNLVNYTSERGDSYTVGNAFDSKMVHESSFQNFPVAKGTYTPQVGLYKSKAGGAGGLRFLDGYERKDDLGKLDDLITKFKDDNLMRDYGGEAGAAGLAKSSNLDQPIVPQ